MISTRGYLILDIETVPDPLLYKAPEAAPETAKPFPPLYAHRPIVMGVLWLDEHYNFKRIRVIRDHDDDPAMLRDFSRFAQQWPPPLLPSPRRPLHLPLIIP